MFQAYAGMLQLDISRFKQDMDDPEIQRQIVMDQNRGAAIGVKTTPTIFLNNQVVPANELRPDEFPKAVEAASKSAKPSS